MELLDFADHEYINLVTYKKDNTSVKTPVWVAKYDNYLVITSSKSAGKVKRIKNNGKATIYITDQMGSSTLSEPVNVKASLIEDEDIKQEALNKIIKKRPFVFYMHPYELNHKELDNLNFKIPIYTRMHQGLGRKHFLNNHINQIYF